MSKNFGLHTHSEHCALGAMGVEGVYPSMWEDKVGSGPTGYLIAKWIK